MPGITDIILKDNMAGGAANTRQAPHLDSSTSWLAALKSWLRCCCTDIVMTSPWLRMLKKRITPADHRCVQALTSCNFRQHRYNMAATAFKWCTRDTG